MLDVLLIIGVSMGFVCIIVLGVYTLLSLPVCDGDTVRIFNYDVTKRDRITELEKRLEEKEATSVDLLDRDNFDKIQHVHDEMQPLVKQILLSDIPVSKVIAYLLLQYDVEFFDPRIGTYFSYSDKKDLKEHCRRILLRK